MKSKPPVTKGYRCPRCNNGRLELGKRNAHCTNNKCRYVGSINNFVAKPEPLTCR